MGLSPNTLITYFVFLWDVLIKTLSLLWDLSLRYRLRASERQIPLVGISLWAAQKIKNQQSDNPFAFPRYCNSLGCNANSASSALNKWMKESTGNGYVLHSFRHSMRDRLRNVECPSEIIDQIGGWTRESIGEGYGDGHSLELKWKYINKI